MGQNVLFFTIFGYLRGPEGGGGSDWTYLAIYLCTCEISKQSDKNFFSSTPKYKFFSSYLGILVAKFSGQYDLITEQTYVYNWNK